MKIVCFLVTIQDNFCPAIIRKAGVAATAFLFLLLSAPSAGAQTKIQQSERILQPGGETAEHDTFGGAAAISGNTMIIGADNADGNEVGAGAAYIFDKIGNQWVQTAKLFAADGHAIPLGNDQFESDAFGLSVAIDGDTAVVGAPVHSHPGKGNKVGAVYLFQRVNGVWSQQAELFSPFPNVQDEFGQEQGFGGVGISRDTVVVADSGSGFFTANPGAVDVFQRVNGSWALATQLRVPADPFFLPTSLSFDGKTLVAGSSLSDSPSVFLAGVAYVFQFRDGQWTGPVTLAADDATTNAQFGASVSVKSNLIAVGANTGTGTTGQSGAAYLFANEDDVWRQKTKLIANDGLDFDNFGVAVAVDDEAVLVGANEHTSSSAAPNAGSVYVFRKRDENWQRVDELSASDAISGGDFGFAVAIQNNTLLIGADTQHPQFEGYPGGEAYVFRLNPE